MMTLKDLFPVAPTPCRPTRALLAAPLLAFLLAGCAVTPEPLTLEQQVEQAAADRTAMFAAQQPLAGPVSLEEAMARAVAYNLQHRQLLLERALEDRLLDGASLEMLPKLAARAGLRTRSNVAASVSESVNTGRVSLEASTSQDRNLGTADLQLSWNVLDFGLSYFGAKAQANKLLAAEERRRRVVLNLLEQVRVAWWEAATAERLRPQVQAVLAEARDALAKAGEAEQQRLLAPLDALRYQKSLLEVVQQLEALDAELAIARAQLASLMNLPPGTAFAIAPVGDGAAAQVPGIALPLEDLEAVAMVRRPELREEAYVARNVAIESRMALLRLLPGATLFAGLNADSNSFLVNNEWADAGLQVSWNLVGLATLPQTLKTADAKEQAAEGRRQALRMAVLTQVHLAYRRYERSAALYRRFQALQEVESRIREQTAMAADNDAQTALERIRSAAAAVLATRARDRSWAELQASFGAVHQAAGLDLAPNDFADQDLAQITAALAQAAQDLATRRIEVPALVPAKATP